MVAFVAIHSDKHGGAWAGLANPDAILKAPCSDETFRPPVTDFQKWLWESVYLWGIDRIKSIVGDAPLYLMDGGDSVHGAGAKLQELQLLHEGQQIDLAVANYAPWWESGLKIMNTYMLYGTSIHGFGEGTAEDVIAARLCVDGHPATVQHHSLVTVEDAEMDFSHHGPPAGNRKYLEGNIAELYGRDVAWKSLLDLGQKPPALICRFHRHQYVHRISIITAGCDEYLTHVYICPSLCGMDSYARKATQSAMVQRFGMLLIAVEGDCIRQTWPLIRQQDARRYIYAQNPGVSFGQRVTDPKTAGENEAG